MWNKKALPGFEPGISCLLDRRFNQLSHRARQRNHYQEAYLLNIQNYDLDLLFLQA